MSLFLSSFSVLGSIKINFSANLKFLHIFLIVIMTSPLSSFPGSSSSDEYVGFVRGDYIPPGPLRGFSDEFSKLEKAVKNLNVPHRIGMTPDGELLLYLETNQKISLVKSAPGSQTPKPNSDPEKSKTIAAGQSPKGAVKKIEQLPEKMTSYYQLIPITNEVVNWRVEKVPCEGLSRKQWHHMAMTGTSKSFPRGISVALERHENAKANIAHQSSSSFLRVISGPKVPYKQPGLRSLCRPKELTVKSEIVHDWESMESKDDKVESLSNISNTDFSNEINFGTDTLLAALAAASIKLERLPGAQTETNLNPNVEFKADVHQPSGTATASTSFIRVISGPNVSFKRFGIQFPSVSNELAAKSEIGHNVLEPTEESLSDTSDTDDSDDSSDNEFETDMLLAAASIKLKKISEAKTETNLNSKVEFKADQSRSPDALSEGTADASTQTSIEFEDVVALLLQSASNPTAANTRNPRKPVKSLHGSSSV